MVPPIPYQTMVDPAVTPVPEISIPSSPIKTAPDGEIVPIDAVAVAITTARQQTSAGKKDGYMRVHKEFVATARTNTFRSENHLVP